MTTAMNVSGSGMTCGSCGVELGALPRGTLYVTCTPSGNVFFADELGFHRCASVTRYDELDAYRRFAGSDTGAISVGRSPQ